MRFQRPPGTHDVYPGAQEYQDNSALWLMVERSFRDVCRVFAYEEIRTPAFEYTELYTRAVGDGTDIVSKEMYTFEDRGGRSLTLRPEGTAGVIRAYLENGINARGGVAKLYYIAPNFRAERQQKGRYKQHTQCGVEALGSQDPRLDAEVIQLAQTMLAQIGVLRTDLSINSVGCPACRPAYRDVLVAYARAYRGPVSDENRRRLEQNPLRMLDSKEPEDQAMIAGAPSLLESLCAECATHFSGLQTYLAMLDIPFRIEPRLVRGFDYYTKTAFEFTSPDLGAQATLCGGGRYDGLVEELGGTPTPGIGFGMGVERILIALQTLQPEPPDHREPSAYIVALGEEASRQALAVLADLRRHGMRADMDFAGKSFKAQMRAADRSGARYALILGDEEIAGGVVSVKDLTNATQEQAPLNSFIEYLQGKIEGR